jgi:hypothetical protein
MSGGQPPKISDLVAAERARPNAPDSAKAAARAQLALLLGPSAGLGSAKPASPAAPSATSGGGSPASTVATAAKGAGLAKLAMAFVLGGALTAGVLEGVRRPEPSSTPVSSSPASSTAPSAVSSPASPSSTAATTSPLVHDTAPVPSAASAAPPLSSSASRGNGNIPAREDGTGEGDKSLAGERVLLERARSALARGDGEQALAAANQHATKYPHGQLAEEREALAIQALVAAGRAKEAADRAGRFRLAYPDSVLLPVVDEALR